MGLCRFGSHKRSWFLAPLKLSSWSFQSSLHPFSFLDYLQSLACRWLWMLHSLSRTHIAPHHWFSMTSDPRLGSLGPIYWMLCKFLCSWCSMLRAWSCSADSKTMFCQLRYRQASKSCSWTWWLNRQTWRLSWLCDRVCFLLLFTSTISAALPLSFPCLSSLLVLWQPVPYLFFFIPPAKFHFLFFQRSLSAWLTLFDTSQTLHLISFYVLLA